MTLTQAMETPFRKTTYTEQEEEQIRKRVEESVKQKIDAMSPVQSKQTVSVSDKVLDEVDREYRHQIGRRSYGQKLFVEPFEEEKTTSSDYMADTLDAVNSKKSIAIENAMSLSNPFLVKQQENTEPLDATPYANKNYSYEDVERIAEQEGVSIDEVNENAINVIKENSVGTLVQKSESQLNPIWKGLEEDFLRYDSYDYDRKEQTDQQRAWESFVRSAKEARSTDELMLTQGQKLGEFRQKARDLTDILWNMYGSAGTTKKVDRVYGATLDAYLSAYFGKSISEIADNREKYKTLVMGRNVDDVSTLEAMGRAFLSDSISTRIAMNEWMYYITKDSRYQDNVDDLVKRQQRFYTDYADRNAVSKVFIDSMPILAQGLKMWATMLVTGGIGSAIGSAVGMKKALGEAVQASLFSTMGKNIGVRAGFGLSVVDTFMRESGSTMLELSELTDAYGNKLNDSLILTTGILTGLVNTFWEYLTPEPFTKKMTSFNFKSVFKSGIASTISNVLLNTLAGGISESSEEFLQTFTSDVFTALAKYGVNSMGNASFDMSEDNWYNWFADGFNSFGQAFFPSMLVGLAGTGRAYVQDVIKHVATSEDYRKNFKTEALRTLDTYTTPENSTYNYRKEAETNQVVPSRNSRIVSEFGLSIEGGKLSKEERQQIREQYENEDGKMPAIVVKWDSSKKMYTPIDEANNKIAQYLYSDKRAKGFVIEYRNAESVHYPTSTVSILTRNNKGSFDQTNSTITFDTSRDRENFLTNFEDEIMTDLDSTTTELKVKDQDGNDVTYTVKLSEKATQENTGVNTSDLDEDSNTTNNIRTRKVKDQDGKIYEVFDKSDVLDMLTYALPSMSEREASAIAEWINLLPANIQDSIIQKLKKENGDIRDFIVSADDYAMENNNNPELMKKLEKGRALALINEARIVLKDGKTRGKDVVHEVFHVLWNLFPEYRSELVKGVTTTLKDTASKEQLKRWYEDNRDALNSLKGNKFKNETVGKVNSWESFLSLLETVSDEKVEADIKSGNPAIEELFARMSTAILIDPSEGAMNSLPSTLKDIFKKIVQKLKSLYRGLIGEFNNRNFAPRTLEDAVLSIYQDGNTYTATDNLNQRVRYIDEGIEEELRQKYSEKFIKSTNKQVASEEETRIIKEIIQSYPKHQVANGVEMIDGLQNDNHDMPMQKEYLTARLTKELLGKDLILLPRYMDRFLNDIAGYQRFDNYSLSDGISALAEDGRTYEFKFTNSFGKIRNKLKKATEKADVAVVVISTPISLNRLENVKFESNSEAYVINVYNPQEMEIANKKASNEWRVYTDTKSELKPEISSSIINIASELREVNPQDQTTMDYSVYNSNSKDARQLALQMNMESNPSIDVDLLKGYHDSATVEQQSEFAVAVQEALVDENGRDIIDKHLGLDSRKIKGSDHNFGIGVYSRDNEVQISVGQQNLIKVNLDENGNITEADREKLDMSCLMHAIFLRQDAVTWGYIKKSTEEYTNAVVLDIDRNLSAEEMTELYNELGNDDYGIIANPNGAWIVNFGEGSNEDFTKQVDAVIDNLGNEWQDKLQVVYVDYDGNYISVGNWEEGNNAYSIPRERIYGEYEKVYRDCYNELQPSLQKVYDEFSEKYNWGNAGTIPTPEDVTETRIRYSEELEGGYDNTAHMSNRAVRAYENSEMPISKWNGQTLDEAIEYTSDASQEVVDILKGLPVEAKKNLLKWSSWHHTGIFFNETDFYTIGDLSDVSVKDAETYRDEWNQYKKDKREYPKKLEEIKLGLKENQELKESYSGKMQIVTYENAFENVSIPSSISEFASNSLEYSRSGNAYKMFQKPNSEEVKNGLERLEISEDGKTISLTKYNADKKAYETIDSVNVPVETTTEDLHNYMKGNYKGSIVSKEDVDIKKPYAPYLYHTEEVRYSEELEDDDTQDYGDTFNVDNPKSIINRNIRTWDALVDSDVDQFIAQDVYLPTEVLKQHGSLKSVQQEIEDRNEIDLHLEIYPQIRDIASESKTVGEFIQRAKKDVYSTNLTDNDERLLRKYYNYSQTLSPTDFLSWFTEMYANEKQTTLEDLLALKKVMGIRREAKVTSNGDRVYTVVANDTRLSKVLSQIDKNSTDADVKNAVKEIKRRAMGYMKDFARTLLRSEKASALKNTSFNPVTSSWLAIALGSSQEDAYQAHLKADSTSAEMSDATSSSDTSDTILRSLNEAINLNADEREAVVKNIQSLAKSNPFLKSLVELGNMNPKEVTISMLVRAINKLEEQIDTEVLSKDDYRNRYNLLRGEIKKLNKENREQLAQINSLFKEAVGYLDKIDDYKANYKRLQKLLM